VTGGDHPRGSRQRPAPGAARAGAGAGKRSGRGVLQRDRCPVWRMGSATSGPHRPWSRPTLGLKTGFWRFPETVFTAIGAGAAIARAGRGSARLEGGCCPCRSRGGERSGRGVLHRDRCPVWRMGGGVRRVGAIALPGHGRRFAQRLRGGPPFCATAKAVPAALAALAPPPMARRSSAAKREPQ
jgi:hypothetical protein